jgi:hypothetical protein
MSQIPSAPDTLHSFGLRMVLLELFKRCRQSYANNKRPIDLGRMALQNVAAKKK